MFRPLTHDYGWTLYLETVWSEDEILNCFKQSPHSNMKRIVELLPKVLYREP
jgi:hypothetical protein